MSEELDDLLDPGVSGNQNGDFSQAGLVNSTAILVLGICSIVGCVLYAIPGLICGIIALILFKKTKQVYLTNPAKYESGYKNAKAGYICAIIGTSLSAIYFIAVIVWISVFLTAINSIAHY